MPSKVVLLTLESLYHMLTNVLSSLTIMDLWSLVPVKVGLMPQFTMSKLVCVSMCSRSSPLLPDLPTWLFPSPFSYFRKSSQIM